MKLRGAIQLLLVVVVIFLLSPTTVVEARRKRSVPKRYAAAKVTGTPKKSLIDDSKRKQLEQEKVAQKPEVIEADIDSDGSASLVSTQKYFMLFAYAKCFVW